MEPTNDSTVEHVQVFYSIYMCSRFKKYMECWAAAIYNFQ